MYDEGPPHALSAYHKKGWSEVATLLKGIRATMTTELHGGVPTGHDPDTLTE
jgi:hypothetical protein